jgi:hypothetical protein
MVVEVSRWFMPNDKNERAHESSRLHGSYLPNETLFRPTGRLWNLQRPETRFVEATLHSRVIRTVTDQTLLVKGSAYVESDVTFINPKVGSGWPLSSNS